jgi:hypothetical protein
MHTGSARTSAISDTQSGALTVFNLSGKLWGPKLPNSAVCLPIAYLAHPLSTNSSKTGAPEKIRTSDLCLRRAALYPAELRAHSALHSLRGRQRQRWMRRGGACDKVKVQTFSRAQSPPGRDRTAGEGPAVHRQQGGRRPGSAFRILRPRKGLTIAKDVGGCEFYLASLHKQQLRCLAQRALRRLLKPVSSSGTRRKNAWVHVLPIARLEEQCRISSTRKNLPPRSAEGLQPACGSKFWGS